MKEQAFAQRYAKALFSLAQDSQKTDTVREELAAFRKLLADNAELHDVFHNPVYAAKQRSAILQEVAQKLDFSSVTRQFLALLADKKRTPLFDVICESYQALLDQQKQILHVEVTSARPLSQDLQAQLKQRLQEKTGKQQIVLALKEDPTLLGGFVVRIDGRIYDGSLQTRFGQMKEHLLTQIA